MELSEILLDKRIACTFIDSDQAENVIFCRPLEESLYDVTTFTVRGGEFIHKFINESTGNYLVTDICLDDGTVYENVKFKIVVSEASELPYSTINTYLLEDPQTTVHHKSVQLLEEEIEPVVETIDEGFNAPVEITENLSSAYLEKAKALEEDLKRKQTELQQRESNLEARQILVETNQRLQKTLEEYKSELLAEYYSVNEQQKELLFSRYRDAIKALDETLEERIDEQKKEAIDFLNTLSTSNLEQLKTTQDQSINRIKVEIDDLVKERFETNTVSTDKLLVERTGELQTIFAEKLVVELESHKRAINDEIGNITSTINSLIDEKLKTNTEETDKLLISRSGDLQTQFAEQFNTDFITYKNSLFDEFKITSESTATILFDEKTEELNTALTKLINEHKFELNETVTKNITEISNTVNSFTKDIDSKIPALDKTIKDINSRVENLIKEKRNVQLLVDDAKKYTDTKVAQVSEEVMNYARRILDLGSGGGSNAVQYANGGTMNGSLNVTGQYLSGGVDLASIFSGGGGGNQTLTFNSTNANLSISNGNTVSLSALSATGSAGDPAVNSLVHSNSANWNNSYTTVNAGSANWNSAYNVATTYQTASSTFATNTLLQSTSALLTPLTLTNTLTSQLVLNTDFNSYKTSVAASTATLLPTSIYQTASGSFITAVSGTANQINASKSGSTVTLSLPQSAVFPGDVNIIGNLTIAGSATYINTKNLVVGDNIIYFNDNNYGSNVLDVGIVSHFTQAPLGYNHTGLVRRAGGGVPGVWTLFSGLTTEPISAANLDWNDKNIVIDSLSANLIGNVTGNADTVTNGVYTNGSYSNPSWITSLADTKITGPNRNNWDSTYTTVSSNSANWNSVYQSASSQPYKLVDSTSSIQPIRGSNTASGNYSVVLGGISNNASGCYSNIAGGHCNTASGYDSNVGGGSCNNASGNFSVVAGGGSNVACGYGASISGGSRNYACGARSHIGNGENNTASNSYSFVGTGSHLTASGYASNVVSGRFNCATGFHSSIASGFNNTASGVYSAILGGKYNSTNNQCNAFILGSNITALTANYTYVNNLSSQGLVTTADLKINKAPQTFINPVTASGTFLVISINGVNKALQLWDYSS